MRTSNHFSQSTISDVRPASSTRKQVRADASPINPSLGPVRLHVSLPLRKHCHDFFRQRRFAEVASSSSDTGLMRRRAGDERLGNERRASGRETSASRNGSCPQDRHEHVHDHVSSDQYISPHLKDRRLGTKLSIIREKRSASIRDAPSKSTYTLDQVREPILQEQQSKAGTDESCDLFIHNSTISTALNSSRQQGIAEVGECESVRAQNKLHLARQDYNAEAITKILSPRRLREPERFRIGVDSADKSHDYTICPPVDLRCRPPSLLPDLSTSGWSFSSLRRASSYGCSSSRIWMSRLLHLWSNTTTLEDPEDSALESYRSLRYTYGAAMPVSPRSLVKHQRLRVAELPRSSPARRKHDRRSPYGWNSDASSASQSSRQSSKPPAQMPTATARCTGGLDARRTIESMGQCDGLPRTPFTENARVEQKPQRGSELCDVPGGEDNRCFGATEILCTADSVDGCGEHSVSSVDPYCEQEDHEPRSSIMRKDLFAQADGADDTLPKEHECALSTAVQHSSHTYDVNTEAQRARSATSTNACGSCISDLANGTKPSGASSRNTTDSGSSSLSRKARHRAQADPDGEAKTKLAHEVELRGCQPTNHCPSNFSVTSADTPASDGASELLASVPVARDVKSTLRGRVFGLQKPSTDRRAARHTGPRCWKCEIAARRVHGLMKVRHVIEWTCFCNFRAYADEAPDAEANNVIRAFGEHRDDTHGLYPQLGSPL